MGNSKAAGVLSTISLLDAKGAETSAAFWQTLSPEDQKYFKSLLPVSRLPLEKAEHFFELAVPFIYPEKNLEEGLWQLGHDTAWHDLRGIYKILLKIATVEMILKHSVSIWKTYHDKGIPTMRRLDDHHVQFTIGNYPDMPQNFLHVLAGYYVGLIELTMAKNVTVASDPSDPNLWKHLVTYD